MAPSIVTQAQCPSTIMESKAGRLRLVANDANHVHIGTLTDEGYRVNGVDYYVSMHVELNDEGTWTQKYGNTYIRRNTGPLHEPTRAAYTAITKDAVEAVQQWFANTPDLTGQATDYDRQCRVANVDREIEAARATIAKLEQQRAAILAEAAS